VGTVSEAEVLERMHRRVAEHVNSAAHPCDQLVVLLTVVACLIVVHNLAVHRLLVNQVVGQTAIAMVDLIVNHPAADLLHAAHHHSLAAIHACRVPHHLVTLATQRALVLLLAAEPSAIKWLHAAQNQRFSQFRSGDVLLMAAASQIIAPSVKLAVVGSAKG